ncbi:serine/threonine dehydratase [Actinorhabdospora filicis]|uniref:threonine ammonia-lyase n=1 Tax=Actinorhabdospora filicis TaxID=1785913 RepID=A0A9W6SNW3_9ACTN|nr:threonine/serine dehydratase [Actinorhabdospora filicis]GLZ79423.1 serine/threonine dehydratase [Actinorhabdospora filicis]
MLITIDDVAEAARNIDGLALRTPLLPAAWAGELWLKAENLQPIGAFKIRGAANAVARLPEATPGVATHSSGNHGRALGYAARAKGIACVVVVPEGAPPVKLAAIAATGAELVTVAPADRDAASAKLAAERGYALIPPFDHRDVIAGQGTIGPEILADLPDVDTVVVPVGGGGLASGVATAVKALKPGTRVIGVEPEWAADAKESLEAGRRIAWPVERTYRTLADGVRTCLSDLTYAHLAARLDAVVTVTEDELSAAVGELARRSCLVAEPSGALTTAAYLRYGAEWGRTAAVISGGNLEPALLADLVR